MLWKRESESREKPAILTAGARGPIVPWPARRD
jgi:hypothetical protein